MSRDGPDSVFVPDIVVLCCQRSLAAGVAEAGDDLGAEGLEARLVVLPCSSKLREEQLLRILERGADAVQVVGCPEGSCRFQVGSRMAEKRVARARDLLGQIGFGEERASMERARDMGRRELVELAARRAEAVGPLGPSPMKGDGTP